MPQTRTLLNDRNTDRDYDYDYDYEHEHERERDSGDGLISCGGVDRITLHDEKEGVPL